MSDAAAEIKRMRESIAQKDAQLTDLRGKGRDMLGRLKAENAELNARQASHVSIPHRCRPAPVVSLPVITHRSAQCSQFDEQMR